MARADVIAATANSSAVHFNGAGTHRPIQTVGGLYTYYQFFIDSGADLALTKSYDGITWTTPSILHAGTLVAFCVWYRRDSGINSDVIDIWMTVNDGGFVGVKYMSLNTATDTLSSEVTVFTGVSTASGGSLSGTVCRDGTLRVMYNIDNGTEDGTASSADNGATWADTIADATEGATQDQFYLLPGWNSDQADFMAIYVDASANGLSVKRYDDSANTWTESAIIADGSFVDVTAGNNYPHVACAVDLANSRNVVIAWNAVNAANGDLKCYTIDDTTIITKTDVVLNSTLDQGFAALGIEINSGNWYAFYAGKTDGSETFNTNVALYYKISPDAGSTWGSETRLTWTDDFYSILWLSCTSRFDTDFLVAFLADRVNDQIVVSAPLPSGGASGLIVNRAMSGGING